VAHHRGAVLVRWNLFGDLCPDHDTTDTGDRHAEALSFAIDAAAEARRAEHQARRDEKARAEVRAARERLKPLDERLARLLATIPLDVRREGLSLATLQASLRGRSRGNAHPGDIGNAMRKLKYVRRRNWHKDASGFRALLYPT
jgi:hypothetical protein